MGDHEYRKACKGPNGLWAKWAREGRAKLAEQRAQRNAEMMKATAARKAVREAKRAEKEVKKQTAKTKKACRLFEKAQQDLKTQGKNYLPK